MCGFLATAPKNDLRLFPSLSLPLSLSVRVFRLRSLSACLSVCLSVCLSLCLFVSGVLLCSSLPIAISLSLCPCGPFIAIPWSHMEISAFIAPLLTCPDFACSSALDHVCLFLLAGHSLPSLSSPSHFSANQPRLLHPPAQTCLPLGPRVAAVRGVACVHFLTPRAVLQHQLSAQPCDPPHRYGNDDQERKRKPCLPCSVPRSARTFGRPRVEA